MTWSNPQTTGTVGGVPVIADLGLGLNQNGADRRHRVRHDSSSRISRAARWLMAFVSLHGRTRCPGDAPRTGSKCIDHGRLRDIGEHELCIGRSRHETLPAVLATKSATCRRPRRSRARGHSAREI